MSRSGHRKSRWTLSVRCRRYPAGWFVPAADTRTSGADFCSSCGAPLGEPEDETTLTLAIEEAASRRRARRATSTELPPGVGLLVVRHGPDAGQPFRLEAENTRSAATPTPTSSSTTSPSRAATSSIDRDDDGYVVRDVGSLNGTYVNRERVDEAPLHARRRGPDRPLPAHLRHSASRGSGVTMAERAPPLDRRRSRPAARRVPRHHDLEDPVPREPGSHRPGAHAVGYRKFYAADVERLRFILRQQREHFLPLKVIKERLDEMGRSDRVPAIDRGVRPRRRPRRCA